MAADERTLLNNVLDSLDRLYDRDCGPFDVYMLLTAPAGAISDQTWIVAIEDAAAALKSLMHAKLPTEERHEQSLIVTNDLRLKLADFYE